MYKPTTVTPVKHLEQMYNQLMINPSYKYKSFTLLFLCPAKSIARDNTAPNFTVINPRRMSQYQVFTRLSHGHKNPGYQYYHSFSQMNTTCDKRIGRSIYTSWLVRRQHNEAREKSPPTSAINTVSNETGSTAGEQETESLCVTHCDALMFAATCFSFLLHRLKQCLLTWSPGSLPRLWHCLTVNKERESMSGAVIIQL